MKRPRVRRPSPSMVIALLALFVALGGTGYAAFKLPKNSVGTKQLKKNAVNSSKVKDNSLLAQDFAAGQLPQGPQGAKGEKGDRGLPGPSTGPAGGALTGTYPNPTIAPNAITGPELASGAVTPDKIGAVPSVRVQAPAVNSDCDSVTVPNSTQTTIYWNAVATDTASMSASCSPDLTAPRAGFYLVEAELAWGANTTGSRYIALMQNGTQRIASDERPASTGSEWTQQGVATLVHFNAGQTVRVVASQTSASASSIDLPDTATRLPHFAMTWLGPG